MELSDKIAWHSDNEPLTAGRRNRWSNEARKLAALKNYAQHRIGCSQTSCDCGLTEVLADLERTND